jgi:CRISPR-associated protein Cas1
MSNLFSRICRPDTLRRAWSRVQKRGQTPGVDGVTLEYFGQKAERRLARLGQQLSEGRYRPRPLRRCEIPKGEKGKGGGKEAATRVLAIPAVRDRVAQAAALLVLQPVVEDVLQPCSFGYRPGRGHRDALRAVRQLRDGEGCRYVAEADIRAFFESVDRERCLRQVETLAPEPELRALLAGWLDAPVLGRKGKRYETSGLPQGTAVSPLLSNLYLDAFDRAMLEGGHHLVRFADDFVVLCRSEAGARRALRAAEEHLGACGLALHDGKTGVTTFARGFRFLGARFEGREMETPGRAPQPPRNGSPKKSRSPEKSRSSKQPRPRDERAPSSPAAGNAPAREPRHGGESRSSESRGSESHGEDGEQAREAGAKVFLRTLYLHRQGSVLRVKGERFVVTPPGEKKTTLLSLPMRKVEQVVVFGTCHLTAAARRRCLARGVPVTLLSSTGRYYGRLESTLARDVARRRRQFLKTTDEDFALDVARRLVRGKLRNARALLRRRLDGPGLAERHRAPLQKAVRRLERAARQAETAGSLPSLRGIEGTGAAAYFGVFDRLLPPDAPAFSGRTRRPPTDPINALLSFGYTLLFNNLYSIVRMRRLSPYAGFLHATTPGHPALVSDPIEEFRCLIDAQVVHLVGRGTFRAEHFRRAEEEGGGCRLTDGARKRFIRAFEKLMRRRFTSPPDGREMTYRQGLDRQVRRFARHLEGEASYTPFQWR